LPSKEERRASMPLCCALLSSPSISVPHPSTGLALV